jgi:hypothetical protein
VTNRYRRCVDVALLAYVGERTLRYCSSDGIGTVEDYDVGSGLAGGLEKIADYGFVGIEADSGVLKVNEDGVKLAQGVG